MNPQEHKGSRDLAIFLHSQLSTAEATQDPREVDLSDGPGASPLTPLLGKNPQEPREPGASKEQSRERCSPDHTPRAPQTATLTLLMDPPGLQALPQPLSPLLRTLPQESFVLLQSNWWVFSAKSTCCRVCWLPQVRRTAHISHLFQDSFRM